MCDAARRPSLLAGRRPGRLRRQQSRWLRHPERLQRLRDRGAPADPRAGRGHREVRPRRSGDAEDLPAASHIGAQVAVPGADAVERLRPDQVRYPEPVTCPLRQPQAGEVGVGKSEDTSVGANVSERDPRGIARTRRREKAVELPKKADAAGERVGVNYGLATQAPRECDPRLHHRCGNLRGLPARER
jgi:hypothetical protein